MESIVAVAEHLKPAISNEEISLSSERPHIECSTMECPRWKPAKKG